MSSCCQKPDPNAGEPPKSPAKPYPLDTCLVSDAKLGAHGEPYAFEYEGQQIKLCCEGCLPKFHAEPAHYLAKLPGFQPAEHSCCEEGPRTAEVAKTESSCCHAEPAPTQAEHSCCGGGHATVPEPPKHSCCGGGHDGHHSADEIAAAARTRKPASKYFCPMCPGVESDEPGTCPKCGMSLERNPTYKAPRVATKYTCPMHPEVVQDHPGTCPKCGMALEPMTPSAADEEDPELRDMTRRFWIGTSLALPVFILAMAHLLPGLAHDSWVAGDVSRWIQFGLSTPVVLWAGWPIIERGWNSVRTRNLNMFTLIAIGVGTAYLYSAAAMVVPQLFPESIKEHGRIGVYFESAAVITVLVLLGQVLEGRARSRRKFKANILKLCS